MTNVAAGADPVTVSQLAHHSPYKQNMGSSSSTLSIGKERELFCFFFFFSLSFWPTATWYPLITTTATAERASKVQRPFLPTGRFDVMCSSSRKLFRLIVVVLSNQIFPHESAPSLKWQVLWVFVLRPLARVGLLAEFPPSVFSFLWWPQRNE